MYVVSDVFTFLKQNDKSRHDTLIGDITNLIPPKILPKCETILLMSKFLLAQQTQIVNAKCSRKVVSNDL